ncbi:uncharacterized protein LOC130700751 [Daphnia carinata]|uniref:uncharacterized protein LOC130700751 n=1 Tax=Daphnia carinata TaxID=120202 RepID=UPI00257FCFCD|nr:uncharacterized protein LOC130700751 [Daphnia carinata]
MKLTLIFLTCFVGLSYQQRYVWPMPYAPRAHLMPLFYADGQPAADVEILPEVKEIDNQAKNEPEIQQDHEKVFLPLASPVLNFKPFTTTTTFTSTSVSVVSTPTTVKCIPSTKFSIATAANLLAIPVVTEVRATSACARRRRDLEHLLADAESAKASIEPAQPIALEVSAIEPLPVADVKDASFTEPEIESSQLMNLSPEVVQEDPSKEDRGLLNLSLTTTISVTTVTTVISFAGATVKSTANIAADNALLCLPSGFTVC